VSRRLSLVFLSLASPAAVVLSFFPCPACEWAYALLVTAFPFALIAFSVGGGGGRLGAFGLALIALLLLFEGSVIGMLLLRGRVFDAPWFGGLPAGAALQLYGLFVVPLVPVALLYALSFSVFGLRGEDLEQLAGAGDSDRESR
jgi:hypothetical protein